MSDSLNIIIKTLLAENSAIDLQKQLEIIEKKLKPINLKATIDTSDLQLVTKQADEVAKKLKTKTLTKDSLFINKKLEKQAFDEITAKMREVKKGVTDLSVTKLNMKVDSNGVERLGSAVIKYTNETGMAVTETMRWTTALKKVDGELTKVRTFSTTNTQYVDNVSKTRKEQEKLINTMAKAREQSELKGNKQQLQNELAQSKAINKELDNQYKQKQRQQILDEKNSKSVENQIARTNNSLDALRVNKEKVFADDRVVKEVNKLKEMETALKKGQISSKDFALQMQKVRTSVAQVSGEFRNVNKDGYAFFDMIGIASKKVAIWSISTGMIYSSLSALKSGVSYIYDLDNSLNEVRIVTNKTQEEVQGLANSYNQLAKEMSVTTKELTQTAADLYRQGLNDTQVEDRMKGIVEYAKISSISLQDSQRIITSTANATGESVEKIIDIFALLGDTTASGADEIGEALQRVASAAENSNISLEKSASWIATISSITRESASTIGRSLNSVISRYESIKKTGFNSDDEYKLNDVVLALAQIGIKATDSKGQLRDFADIMDEVGAKFSTLSKNEQAYVATAMFGKMCAHIYSNVYIEVGYIGETPLL